MDLVRLGAPYSTQYLPDALIEGYSSAIWTERFFTPGEFEIKTADVDRMMELLPEDTLISHLDTDQVMMVESHTVEDDEDGNPVLTITGRSLDLMLEHRFVESRYQKRRSMRRKYSPVGALSVLLWQAFANTSGKDVTRGDKDDDTGERNDYSWNTQDAIPNVVITDSAADNGTSKDWFLNEGMLLPQIAKMLTKADLGIRVIRPGSESNAQVITVKTNLADRGDVVRTYTTGITAMRFDIYQGIDRSHTSEPPENRVQFSVLQGDITEAQYARSKKDMKTIVEIMTSASIADQARNATERAYTGIRRKVSAIDAGEPDIPDAPDRPEDPRKNATQAEKNAWREAIDNWRDKMTAWRNKRDRIMDAFKEAAIDDAQGELKAKRRLKMFSGNISPMATYQYRVHYGLGDTVSLYGDYDEVQKMIVAEYVRTEDENGDRGYPGLVLP